MVPRVEIPIRPARIITIAMVGVVAGVTPIITPVAPLVVVIVDLRGAWSTSERERVIVIAVSLVFVSRVACVVAITRIEVEHRLPPRPAFGRCCFVSRLRRCSREALP
jgi:cytochrome c biogenesis protein CcdA